MSHDILLAVLSWLKSTNHRINTAKIYRSKLHHAVGSMVAAYRPSVAVLFRASLVLGITYVCSRVLMLTDSASILIKGR
jgi:hypothetical protein